MHNHGLIVRPTTYYLLFLLAPLRWLRRRHRCRRRRRRRRRYRNNKFPPKKHFRNFSFRQLWFWEKTAPLYPSTSPCATKGPLITLVSNFYFYSFSRVGQPKPLICLFSVIGCQDSNSRHLDHESSPITTKLGTYFIKLFSLQFTITIVRNFPKLSVNLTAKNFIKFSWAPGLLPSDSRSLNFFYYRFFLF